MYFIKTYEVDKIIIIKIFLEKIETDIQSPI